MSERHLSVIDATVQDAYAWLRAITEEIGPDDTQRAYLALRGTLHALRDHLPIDEGAHLSAQLPMLIRGIFYEGWDPSKVPLRERSREAFLERVGGALSRGPLLGAEDAAKAVFTVLSQRVTGGEIDEVRNALPQEVQNLWPVQAR